MIKLTIILCVVICQPIVTCFPPRQINGPTAGYVFKCNMQWCKYYTFNNSLYNFSCRDGNIRYSKTLYITLAAAVEILDFQKHFVSL
jgi:hypothetical protein